MDRAREVREMDAADVRSREFLYEHVDSTHPCLLRGAAADWPALVRWTSKDYLADLCGRYPVTWYPHANYLYGPHQHADESVVTFAEALDGLFSAAREVRSLPALRVGRNGEFSELLRDVGSPAFSRATGWGKLPRGLLYEPCRFFLYTGGGGTNWHTHAGDQTLLCQIVGSKRIGLMPTTLPQYRQLRRAFERDANLRDSHAFDGIEPPAEIYRATIRPGDALYIPPHWLHGVEPCDDAFGASASLCWRSPRHVMGNLRYPAVREHWRKALRHPARGLPVLKLLAAGLCAQLARTVRPRPKRQFE
jgi:hypothetical protein